MECLSCWGLGFTIRIPEQHKCETKTCEDCKGTGVKEETK